MHFAGSGAIAGNSMGINREFLAKELGFKNGASLNSINSTGNRDGILDFLFASSATFLGNIYECMNTDSIVYTVFKNISESTVKIMRRFDNIFDSTI